MPGKDETWSERQDAIREILANEEIHGQGELLERLEQRGFTVTQSSVSRDLQELKVAKLGGRYVLAEMLAPPAAAASVSEELAQAAASLLAVREAGPNLLVVLTPPGRAQIVGYAIDHSTWPEVVGTLAGDDTLFIAVPGRREQLRVKARLDELIPEKKRHA